MSRLSVFIIRSIPSELQTLYCYYYGWELFPYFCLLLAFSAQYVNFRFQVLHLSGLKT